MNSASAAARTWDDSNNRLPWVLIDMTETYDWAIKQLGKTKTVKLLLKIYSLWTKINPWQWFYPDTAITDEIASELNKLSILEQKQVAENFFNKTIWKNPKKNWIVYNVIWLFKNTEFAFEFWRLENVRLAWVWKVEEWKRLNPRSN